MTLEQHGFTQIAQLFIGENDRIDRTFAKNPDFKHLIYAFKVGDTVAYIGQTKNLHKRMDSYSNGKYWNNTNQSHIEKSELLEEAVRNGVPVTVWIKHCFKIVITTPFGSSVIANLDDEERKYIEIFDPPLNSKLKVKK
ncbi:denA endonuclease II [Aeromonas phage 31]|uniref:Endonuclease II n=3 Tax=Biquartavirus 44RR2 TaxID=115987 RepID=Q6U997_9CAUD|nr:endonuclease [Aeromonas phage 44RR2.8t]YP_238932.1 endonuclease [Aeromonas phage 31]APU00677.1 endonuclease [Aeromonas phage 44RR2.8t.2]APU01096.1 endonuclease [Aeromonas phage 31.2]APU02006.1 endonuclease [Aeromonas phage L9-6]APU02258.1 endonuclease [Aeromonas phage Riv-10]APU02505.1 endonuclease [Aeromonas phage SW69-9]